MYLTSNTNYGSICEECICSENLVWLSPPSPRNWGSLVTPLKFVLRKICWISQLMRWPRAKSISEIGSCAVLETITYIFCLSFPKFVQGVRKCELDVTYFYNFGIPLYLWTGLSYKLQICCSDWLQGVLPINMISKFCGLGHVTYF